MMINHIVSAAIVVVVLTLIAYGGVKASSRLFGRRRPQ